MSSKDKPSRRKPKASSTPSGKLAEGLSTADVNNTEGWTAIVSILRDSLDLPDLTTRSGLKKVHTDFDTIFGDLERLYENNMLNLKISGAIALIYAKMCVDTILQDKLVEKGILKRIVPLCRIAETRNLALRALSTITHYGGSFVRTEIAKEANILAAILRDVPDDENVAELVILILAHTVSHVAYGGKLAANPTVLRQIDMTLVYNSVFAAVKRPHSRPGMMIDHVLELVNFSSLHTSAAMKACPQSIAFVVAGLRCKDWPTRFMFLETLMRIYRLEAAEVDDSVKFQPPTLLKAIERGYPLHLDKAVDEYGVHRSETLVSLTSFGSFGKAMRDYRDNRDLCTLGRKLVKVILQTEFSIPDGEILPDVKNPMPFSLFHDALRHSASALRQVGSSDDLDFADILDIKYQLLNKGNDEACVIARRGLARNPEQAYFFYALTLTEDSAGGLRAAKQGLQCKLITPFIKHQFMQRAVKHAGDMGVDMLMGHRDVGSSRWNKGIAFLNSAIEDGKAFYKDASPDNRYIKNVGYWLVILTIFMSETLTPDLKELKPVIAKLKMSDDFSAVFGISPPRTEMRLMQQAAVAYYADGVREFGHVFEAYDEYKASGVEAVNCHQAGDPLFEWLENVRREDGTPEGETAPGAGRSHSQFKTESEYLTMYRCSWCTNASAGLRKCGRCGGARYCDATCQKAHWRFHKSSCKK